jgi:hypothetical protein
MTWRHGLWLVLVWAGCSGSPSAIHLQQEALRTPGVILDDVGALQVHFGQWQPVGSTRIDAVGFSPGTGGFHAEAQALEAQGADLTFSADVTFGFGGEANLQARISDEGRYGVSIRESGVRIYRQLLEHDQLRWDVVPGADYPMALAANRAHAVSFTLDGATLSVSVDGVAHQVTDADRSLAVGRLGLYAFRQPWSGASVSFANVRVTTDPARKSNFALLYDTVGYEAAGSKRALVRTLAPVAAIDLARSRYLVQAASGAIVQSGPLRALPDSFGIQLWEADFSSLTTPGSYTVTVEVAAGGAVQRLVSQPFVVDAQRLSARLLRGLTFLDAEARSAADEDLRRNWATRAGAFTVDPDGAFVARNADRGAGALIERVQNGYNAPIQPTGGPYSITGKITILDGCDAQIQLAMNGNERLGVTLQAGGSGCGGGPGAIRLHRETPTTFQPITAHILDDAPFQRGHAYDVLIVSDGAGVTVWVDGILRIPYTAASDPLMSNVGLKVWGGSARFDQVAIWRNGVTFDRVTYDDGSTALNPYANGAACDGSQVLSDANDLLCKPLHRQRHGLNDCNNWIGESNSHGGFLVGLLAAWRDRRALLSAAEVERLRRAILTSFAYLEELYREAHATGRFVHQEYGRGQIDSDASHLYLTTSGLYGEAAFAVDGAAIDDGLARTACRHAWRAAVFLDERGGLPDEHKALFYHQIATCARRDPSLRLTRPVGTQTVTYTPEQLDALAITAGGNFLTAMAGGLPDWARDTGQMIPWLDGVAALRGAYPRETAGWDGPLGQIADLLAGLLGRDGFRVIPEASGLPGAADNRAQWSDLSTVPRSIHAIAASGIYDGRDSYDTIFFATTAYDLVQLGRLTGRRDLERLAAGHLGWILGLNPGVPVNKAAGAGSDDGTVWKSAAFIAGLDEGHARGFENFDGVGGDHVKSWKWPEEDDGRHRQVWWYEPAQNGFLSIVNGETIWDRQWDYHNMGLNGWGSGETFALTDGVFVKSMIAYEDWLQCAPRSCASTGAGCGALEDGCGHTLDCGGCAAGQRCGGATVNQCCQPLTCADRGAECGALYDGCGGWLDCGRCGSGLDCGVDAPNRCGTACVPTKVTCRRGVCATFDDGCGGSICCGGAHCCQ